MTQDAKKSYSHTVNLPQTQFPMKGDLPRREPERMGFWKSLDVFARMNARTGRPTFTLHDGPPYANGHIHMGHVLNKVLKDMVVKSQSLMGKRTPYIPGWDCHGLPIEHALLKEKKLSKRSVTDLPAFRREAAAFAQRFIDIQREEFRRLGVFGSWETPYRTMSPQYESTVLRVFRRLYQAGYIYRGLKTVSWCITCETALAEAEVEYKTKKSPSVYAALPVLRPGAGFPFTGRKAAVLVWTTTPWTLPANLAVALHPKLEYLLVQVRGSALGDRALILARARLEAVLKDLKAQGHEVLGAWSGKDLVAAGLVCETPFGHTPSFPHPESKGVLADYVSAEDGTGIVHTAPGHGEDDFLTGRREGLPVLCPVDPAGRFTEEAGPALRGLHIFKEGNPAVIAALSQDGRLVPAGEIEHSYQHCWRCKNPIAFRATEQWFLSVSAHGLREKLLKSIDAVQWVPAVGRERIGSMVAGRPDWCLSRQRLWGTPIPILRCASCREILADDAVLEAVERRVAAEGSDFWFLEPGRPVTLGAGGAGEALRWDFAPHRACGKCGGESFLRETDILDVWMDSGSSWLAVLGEGNIPCDLYLEGSDQHRGWFQSSLVPAVALEGKAPYKAVLTHGFLLDAAGHAMHKSAGNAVSPQEVVGKLGADVLRLWVALVDYSEDVRLSTKLLEGSISDSYRKIRNTFKFLLGNVSGFDPRKDAVEPARMPELERLILKRLFELDREVRGAYAAYAFRRASTLLLDFCNLTLSAFYLDARKDALYTLNENHPVRRAAQSVMWECVTRLAGLAAPILSFTAEEAWSEIRRLLSEKSSDEQLAESVFLQDLPPAPAAWDDSALAEKWTPVLQLRESVLAALECQRAAKVIGSSLQARWTFLCDDERTLAWFRGLGEEFWGEISITSKAGSGKLDAVPAGGLNEVQIPHLQQKAFIRVEKAEGPKCPRCWRYPGSDGFGAAAEHPELCGRCARQLTA
ncbi:MAG TPA: isoleucine--tRNA ligase [Elusimicrobia bacterium]|nr:isoleucine--tRNA ligase [Elusimicrobiota bacterium]